MSSWQPTINLDNLKKRAELLKKIREFFDEKNILEVETPLLSHATITDPNLHSLTCILSSQKKMYLQTSPEFAMKRLLAASNGAIYQICKAFRNDELGKRHNPEFTMLEWYRPGFNYHQLMDEFDEFLQCVAMFPTAERKSYQEIFEEFINLNPHTATLNDLKKAMQTHDIDVQGMEKVSKDDGLNLLLTHLIEPKLGYDSPLFIYDFPASQAALAKTRQTQQYQLAERFELFIDGMEIANGFHELTDAKEQRKRFATDLATRKQRGLPLVPIDENFLNALEYGIPNCAGVAVGIDRLFMSMYKLSNINEVIAFTIDNA